MTGEDSPAGSLGIGVGALLLLLHFPALPASVVADLDASGADDGGTGLAVEVQVSPWVLRAAREGRQEQLLLLLAAVLAGAVRAHG